MDQTMRKSILHIKFRILSLGAIVSCFLHFLKLLLLNIDTHRYMRLMSALI